MPAGSNAGLVSDQARPAKASDARLAASQVLVSPAQLAANQAAFVDPRLSVKAQQAAFMQLQAERAGFGQTEVSAAQLQSAWTAWIQAHPDHEIQSVLPLTKQNYAQNQLTLTVESLELMRLLDKNRADIVQQLRRDLRCNAVQIDLVFVEPQATAPPTRADWQAVQPIVDALTRALALQPL